MAPPAATAPGIKEKIRTQAGGCWFKSHLSLRCPEREKTELSIGRKIINPSKLLE